MQILGIETSCDETAISVLKVEADTVTVLSNPISSQVKLHAPFGGVVPHLAAREHEKNLPLVLSRAFSSSGVDQKNIDLIAVTKGPGLAPALARGINFAKSLARELKKPLIGANHLEGHIYSPFLASTGETSEFKIQNPDFFPILNLIVSGGHTELVLMKDHGQYQIIGETLDDAVGEAFDKVARILDLGYPGGPIVSKLAQEGSPDKYPLPIPMAKSKDLNFSYSGLKTAVLYLVKNLGLPLSEETKKDICASFQKSALDILITKTVQAAKIHDIKNVNLSGGVSANKYLREHLAQALSEIAVPLLKPDLSYTGDNGAMIALAGYVNYSLASDRSIYEKFDDLDLDANLNFERIEN